MMNRYYFYIYVYVLLEVFNASINRQPISSLTDFANDKCSGFMALCHPHWLEQDKFKVNWTMISMY